MSSRTFAAPSCRTARSAAIRGVCESVGAARTVRSMSGGPMDRSDRPVMKGLWLLGVTLMLCGRVVSVRPADVEWPMHGGTDNIRYSALTQINRDNVTKLQVAWTYDSRDAFKGSEMQSNPVVVDGMLYATTPTLKVVAL